MPTYVWKAKDRTGKVIFREVAAGTGKEAESRLLGEGYTDLALIQDDVVDATSKGMPEARLFGEPIKISAEERARHWGKSPGTLFSIVGQGIGQSKGLILLAFALGGLFLYRGNIVAAVLAGVGLVAWVAFIVCVGLPAIYYRKLNEAQDWHRWDKVLELVATLEKLGSIHFIKLPPPELGRARAKAMAGQGHLSEALAYYQQFAGQPGCPGWLHKAFVASIYEVAGQYDEAIEWTMKSLREHPTGALHRDLAYRLARRKRDPIQAREALKEAQKEPINEMIGKPYDLRTRALIAYLEKDYATARIDLEAALELLEKTRHMAFREGSIAITRAYLCCVLAKQGELAAAHQQFSRSKAYLIATTEKELLAECQTALGSQDASGG